MTLKARIELGTRLRIRARLAPLSCPSSIVDFSQAPNEEMMNGNHTEEEKRNKKNKTKTKRNENEKLEEISEC